MYLGLLLLCLLVFTFHSLLGAVFCFCFTMYFKTGYIPPWP